MAQENLDIDEWTDSFERFWKLGLQGHLLMLLWKAQFLCYMTQSDKRRMRVARNQQLCDDSSVRIYSYYLDVIVFSMFFFPCKLFDEAISGCRQHAGGMLHSVFHISVPSLIGWILLSHKKRLFGTSPWQWLEQMRL